MSLDKIMPPFDIDWVMKEFAHSGEKIISRFVDGVQVFNVNRVKVSLPKDSLCLYVANHQTLLDYFVPTYAILNNNLPYPRKIAGNNLNNWFVKRFMFDFSPWGIIWHDRKDKSKTSIRNYLSAIAKTFNEGRSVFGFAEGARNREIGGDLQPFIPGFFGSVLNARRRIEKPIYLVGIYSKYEGVPEEGFYERIDNSRFGRIGYFAWDVYAFHQWKKRSDKGIARVNFSEPLDLLEIAGGGNRKSQAENVTKNAEEIVKNLGWEIGS